MSKLLYLLSLFSILCVALFYQTALDIVSSLSPQGCRMSRMSPSYLLQAGFDERWTPFAKRYSLWLYREVGWESHQLHGAPVLFIPGNAGSSHQVRSISSSAARQYFSLPYQVAPEFQGGPYKPLDFFTLEFNEDLSAFHGPTLDAETAYTKAAIDYILSLYPSRPQSIILLGHSMGGIVANALLPHPNVSAVITMSTPHALPPARFDRRVDVLYASINDHLADVSTPILSLCGGATDLMIPSESCILPPISPSDPQSAAENGDGYRRTIFSSALEGSWTGVGHREMVWCHQVRWRVARATLEIAASPTAEGRVQALNRWIRDGSEAPTIAETEDGMRIQEGDAEVLPVGMKLVLKEPRGSRTYLFPLPQSSDSSNLSTPARFALFVRGAVPPVAPQVPLSLRASIFRCPSLSFSDDDRAPGSAFSDCVRVQPAVHKLLPQPISGAPFPVPMVDNEGGADESEGIVAFEAEVSAGKDAYIAVKIDDADGRGWVSGGFVPTNEVVDTAGPFAPIFSTVSINLPIPSTLTTTIRTTRILTSSLLVYRVQPVFQDGDAASCRDVLFPPLLEHNSHSIFDSRETHYYPLLTSPVRPVLLHAHTAGPFISPPSVGLDIKLYSTGDTTCALERIDISLDWWGTLGRASTRYASSAGAWAVGVVAIIVWDALSRSKDAATPSVSASLSRFASYLLPRLIPLSFALSLVPLPIGLYLGNSGEPLLSPLAPLLLLVVSGLVSLSWGVLAFSMWCARQFLKLFGARARKSPDVSDHTSRSALLGFAFVVALIALVVPWQVAFLGAWVYHFWTCAAQSLVPPALVEHSVRTGVAIPLIPTSSQANDDDDPRGLRPRSRSSSLRSPSPSPPHARPRDDPSNTFHQSAHLLLMLTWLLPLAAPVLAVWVRTLASAGLTAPFGGDHNVLCVAPALIVVEWAGRGQGVLSRQTRWPFLALAAVAFVVGPRRTYVVFEVASAVLGWIVVAKAGPGWLRWVRR